jgi:hypothetical protein
VFERCFVRGFIQKIEDILSSEQDSGNKGKSNGRAACAKRSERKQGREMAYKKVRVFAKM